MSHVAGGHRPAAAALFDQNVLLLKLGGMWLPPASAPAASRYSYAAFGMALGTFTLASALGEIGGLLFMTNPTLERRCLNVCSSLYRLIALSQFVLFHAHARDIQVLVAEVERLAVVDHGARDPVTREVEALQGRARLVVRRIMTAYACWFMYSSTAVVSQPALEWLLTGARPTPLLPSSFWFLIGPDTPTREAAIYAAQALSQYTSTVIVVAYSSFFAGLTLFLSYQAEVLGVLLSNIPYRAGTFSVASEEHVRQKLVRCITFHQDILNAAMELNRVVRAMMLIIFLSALAFIATMGYQIAVVPPSDMLFVATVMILICTNSLVGGMSLSSDRLRQTTADVVHGVMASDWTDAPPSSRSLMCFVVARASKPSALWCWRAFVVSLPTWLQVLNKSYSVFAVLRSSDK